MVCFLLPVTLDRGLEPLRRGGPDSNCRSSTRRDAGGAPDSRAALGGLSTSEGELWEAEDIKDREIMEKYKGHSNEPMQRNREVTNGEMIQKR